MLWAQARLPSASASPSHHITTHDMTERGTKTTVPYFVLLNSLLLLVWGNTEMGYGNREMVMEGGSRKGLSKVYMCHLLLKLLFIISCS